MSQPLNFILRDVRCFQDMQTARLRPLTLLVGENSTGKTSFLGCYSVLHRMLSGQSTYFLNPPDFNEEPFSMGSFRDIVRSRRGPGGRINEFQLGFDLPTSPTGMPAYQFLATFFEKGSEPVVTTYRYGFAHGEFLQFSQATDDSTEVRTRDHVVNIEFPWSISIQQIPFLLGGDWLVERYPESKPIIDFVKALTSGVEGAERMGTLVPSGLYTPALPNLIPVAPLRAKPKRTYDPIKETTTTRGRTHSHANDET